MTAADVVPGIFRRRVRESPSAPALVADGVAASYRELDERSDRVAAVLCAAGARAESVVALLLGPDPAVVVAMLACLKAGVAYAPIDRAVPSDVFTHDITVRDPHTNEIRFAVRRGFNYPSGSFPAEPGRIPAHIDSRTAVCHSLTRAAAVRCLRGGGSFRR